ncbi:Actin-2 [Oopsacas minuta]|uniref:Actin-2 n=1 Tax=Oopsacas minuta TaxID=111878 RepID=A0AAV7KI50_9METZ|nr:Actin-2 [Oopsacas minuta]
MTGQGIPLVIDAGSHSTKSGFALDSSPSSVFPSIVGYLRHVDLKTCPLLYLRDSYVGDEAQTKRGMLSLKYPFENGYVHDWDVMEDIFDYIFRKELRVLPENHSMMFMEHPHNPKRNTETLTQLMFEKYNIPAIQIQIKATLGLYAHGRTTGVTIHSGDELSYTLPIYEGYPNDEDVNFFKLAGRDITDYLMKLLIDRGYCLSTVVDRENVNNMKENLAYVLVDFQQELLLPDSSIEKKYQLPDGQVITLGRERLCSHAMFQPFLIGMQSDGLIKSIINAIMNAEFDCRKEFFSNIVLTGGNTNFPGFLERLQNEISALAPSVFKVKILSANEQHRKYTNWIGGSIITSLHQFQTYWKTITDYSDYGPQGLVQRMGNF